MSDSNVILHRTREATCKSDLQVRVEGNRRVRRSVHLYRLDRLPAVGRHVCNAVVPGDAAKVKDNLTVGLAGWRPASWTITVIERPLINWNSRISHDAIADDVKDLEELKAIKAEATKTRKGSGR